MTLTQYSFDSQLREEDAELFYYADRSWERKHVRAATDIVRDLKRRGYLQPPPQIAPYATLSQATSPETIIDDSAVATVTLEFTAGAGGAAVIPAGTRVRNIDPTTDGNVNGAVVFLTDVDLTVQADQVATVTATAEHFGEVYNVDAGELVFLEVTITNLASVTNPADASGGVDHQLTRMAVYRTLTLIYMDLLREETDSFDFRRKIYDELYRDELERCIAAGLKVDFNNDGIMDVREEQREHGAVTLMRS